jgi:replicative DNA helicase
MSRYAEDIARQARTNGNGWEPPIPLGQSGKPPVFPAHRFPPWINAYVVAMAEAVQVPVDLPAMLVLSALATAAGARAYVEIKPGYQEQLNLYTATAMAPGARKTPVFMRVTAPLMDHEQSAIEAASPEVAEAKVRLGIAKAAAAKAQLEAEKASPDARDEAAHFAAAQALMAEAITVPTVPRLLVDDATPEALTSLMAEQGGRIAMFSDEGEVFSMMAGRYSSKGPNLAVYLKAHVGSRIRVDRKGREPELVKKPALTLGLTVQPVVLSQLLAIEGARGRGLLGRFLWSVPPSNVGYRRSDPEPVPADVDALFDTNMRALVATLAEWTDPLPLVFTPEATTALMRYQDSIEPRLRDPGGDLAHIADWAGKIVGHVARIAGLLYLATNVRGDLRGPVDAPLVDDAIKIGDYLCIHALHAFQTMHDGPVEDNARAIMRWAKDADISMFSRRQVHQACRYRMPKVEDLKPVLEMLEGTGHIRRLPEPEPKPGGGRPPGPKYQINPLSRL